MSPSLMVFPYTNENIQEVREACTYLPTTRKSDNIWLVRSWFVTHTKKFEEVYFVDEEFLHKVTYKGRTYFVIWKIDEIN